MWTLLRAIFRARRAGLLRLRPATGPIRVECPPGQCGLCCQVMEGVTVRDEERRPDSPLKVIQNGSAATLGWTKNGCVHLVQKSCSVYQDRPAACREYPWYRVGPALFVDMGCPGVRHDGDERPEVHRIVPVQSYLSGLPPLLRSLSVWVFTHW